MIWGVGIIFLMSRCCDFTPGDLILYRFPCQSLSFSDWPRKVRLSECGVSSVNVAAIRPPFHFVNNLKEDINVSSFSSKKLTSSFISSIRQSAEARLGISCCEIPWILPPSTRVAAVAGRVQLTLVSRRWRNVALPGKLSRGLIFRVEP